MDTTAVIFRLKQSPKPADLLARICDFELVEPDAVELDIQMESGHHLNVIAQDGSGGMFALCEAADIERTPVLYVSSEGEAGIVAPDLAAALQLMIQLPYWRDCLKFSGGGEIDEMYKATPYLEREFRQDEPAIDAYREMLLGVLEFEHLPAPVEILYHAVRSTAETCGLITQDGDMLRGLFNTFVVNDNPDWRTNGGNP